VRGKSTKWIVGAGAEGRIVLELWRQACPDADFFFVDDDVALHGRNDLGAPIVGPIAELLSNAARGEVIVAIGNNRVRASLSRKLEECGVEFGCVIPPSAVVLPSAKIERGTILHAGAIVNSTAVVGPHALINTGAIIEHDCRIEACATISPGVAMGGRVRVERGAFVSTGAILAPRVVVGAGSIVGAGAVVVRDIPPGKLAFGVPAVVRGTVGDDFDWSKLL
jgi:sugar O-acyltransferase (sialic acid O-acetyltransferase NeuD family)